MYQLLQEHNAFQQKWHKVLQSLLGMPDYRRLLEWRTTIFHLCWFNTSLTSLTSVTICQCLGLKGEKSAFLFNQCLLLGRFYIYSCKYKNVRLSSLEYVNQVRCNLKIEKHVSIITGTQNTFQQKWHKVLRSLSLPDLSLNLVFHGPIVFHSYLLLSVVRIVYK